MAGVRRSMCNQVPVAQEVVHGRVRDRRYTHSRARCASALGSIPIDLSDYTSLYIVHYVSCLQPIHRRRPGSSTLWRVTHHSHTAEGHPKLLGLNTNLVCVPKTNIRTSREDHAPPQSPYPNR